MELQLLSQPECTRNDPQNIILQQKYLHLKILLYKLDHEEPGREKWARCLQQWQVAISHFHPILLQQNFWTKYRVFQHIIVSKFDTKVKL